MEASAEHRSCPKNWQKSSEQSSDCYQTRSSAQAGRSPFRSRWQSFQSSELLEAVSCSMALPRLRTHDEKHKLSHLEFICVEVSKCNPMRGAQSGHSGADIRSDFQLAPSGQLPGWQHCHWCSPSKACYLESPTLSIRVGCVAASTFEHHFVLTLRK
eukprot:symbB.v1.2.039490.t1/scaffold6602.1/size16768/2